VRGTTGQVVGTVVPPRGVGALAPVTDAARSVSAWSPTPRADLASCERGV